METHLQVLRARRTVLSKPPPTISDAQRLLLAKRGSTPQSDSFSFESHGFYVPLNSAFDYTQNRSRRHENSEEPAGNGIAASHPSAIGSKIAKNSRKRAKRFVTNWTPEMDKVVRKGLTKYGWGSWTRIALSGKLPKEYNAKLIANRARAIGLTKEMFGPQVVPTVSKSKS